MRYYAILNPVAGKGKLAQIEHKLKQQFDHLGIDGEVVKTISPGDAGHLARIGLKKGYSHFLVVGGDGTISEIINGVQDAPVTIGIVPIGEHNLFARTLGCDQYTWQNLLEQYASIPRSVAVDVGKINNYFFLTSVGFGLCVENILDTRTKASKQIRKRSWMKSLASFYSAPAVHETTIMVEKKYAVHVQSYDVQVINSANFFYHDAKIAISHQDRLLDLVIIDNTITAQTARKIRQNRILPGLEGVSRIPGKHFVIQKPQQIVVQLDGELLEADAPLICTPAAFQARFLLPQKY